MRVMLMASGLAWKALANFSSLNRRAASAAFRSLMSRTLAKRTSRPSKVKKLRETSTGRRVPFFRRWAVSMRRPCPWCPSRQIRAQVAASRPGSISMIRRASSSSRV